MFGKRQKNTDTCSMLERLLSGFAVGDGGFVGFGAFAVDYGDFFLIFNSVGLGNDGHVVICVLSAFTSNS